MSPLVTGLGLLGGVAGVLAGVQVLTGATRRLAPRFRSPDVEARLRSWWGMFLLFSVVALSPPAVMVSFLAMLSFLALKELVSLAAPLDLDRRALALAYLTIPAQYAAVLLGSPELFTRLVPLMAGFALPVALLLGSGPRNFHRNLGVLAWGLLTTVYGLSHAALLLRLEVGGAGVGPAALVLLVVLTGAGDVAQWFFGKSFGSTRVVPAVSPGKTRGGLVGGVATTGVLGALLVPAFLGLSPLAGLLVGTVVGLGGFLGDVIMSALKRDLGIKDTGSAIPGHGGFLDRLDSLLLTSPLLFLLLRFALGASL